MTSKTENNLDLNYNWSYGEAGWDDGMDENIIKLGFESRKRVKGILSSPPSSKNNGDSYIVGTAPTGLFSGKFSQIAIWDGSLWIFISPKSQDVVFNTSNGCSYIYNNGWSLNKNLNSYLKVKDFDFSTGYTFTDSSQLLLDPTTEKYYKCITDHPYTVPALTDPTLSTLIFEEVYTLQLLTDDIDTLKILDDSIDISKPISLDNKQETGISSTLTTPSGVIKTKYGVVVDNNTPLIISDRFHLTRWRQARASALANVSNAKVMFLGDSNTVGVGGVSTTAPFLIKYSYPSLAVKLLNTTGAREGGPIGLHGWSSGSYAFTDSRVFIPSGWTNITESVGGHMLENSTNTSAITFTPSESYNTAEVWFACDAAATVNIGPAGAQQNFSLTGGTVEKITMTHTSVTSTTLNISRATGTVRMIGYHCYDSNKGEVSFLNAGRSGWRSDHAANTTTWYSPLNAAAAINPDLCFIQFGINDWNQNIDPTTTFRSSMQDMITKLQLLNTSVVLVIPFNPSATKTYSWSSYRNEILTLAETNNCPVIDITTLLGEAPTPQDSGFVADALHLNHKGYREVANILAHLTKF